VVAAPASRPGLILADIQLADGSSGLDAVNEILPHLSVPVIFVTAFPEKLLTGNKPEPTFLIRKPFRPDALRGVISQALFLYSPYCVISALISTATRSAAPLPGRSFPGSPTAGMRHLIAPGPHFYFFQSAPSTNPITDATAKVAMGCSFIDFST
jgi:CheY-like chemotaxis protein